MIPMLRLLFAHQAWADRTVIDAVRAHAGAWDDAELRKALHHILVVQRFFVLNLLEKPFDATVENVTHESLDDLTASFQQAHSMQHAFIELLDDEELSRVPEIAHFKEIQPTVAEVLMQIVLHSQGHRGQCLTRLRILGATPPTVDFILWLKHRPVTVDSQA